VLLPINKRKRAMSSLTVLIVADQAETEELVEKSTVAA
jgi:hypothetical protein